MNNKLTTRDVRTEDAERLAEIYAHYVQNPAVSFEYEVPTVEEFANRIQKISAKYPYLVCLDQGKVIGYAYAGAYSIREAYAWTATSSIYIDREFRRQGAGAMLYRELEERLRGQGIVNLLAGTAYIDEEDEYLSHDSCLFHRKQGFVQGARLKGIGKKFGRWYDLLWLQKKL